MNKSIVLSVLGKDSPGLVESLAKLIVQHKGEWLESKMANMAGQFAGILRINLPMDQIEAFNQAIQDKSSLGLSVMTAESDGSEIGQGKSYQIELIGQDQPGIVHKISTALAALNLNVNNLHTEVVDASMSGENLFKAQIQLSVPKACDPHKIQDALEDLANELIVDIELVESA